MSDLNHIESCVQEDRRRLAQSLDALSDTVAPKNVADKVTTLAQSYGGEIGQQAWNAARANPAAFAIVGAGLGLLLTGTGARPDRPAAPKLNAVPPHEAMQGFDARVAAADAKIKQEMTGMTHDTTDTDRMRAALMRGLDKLPENARQRVLKARKAALAAQEKLDARARKAAAQTRTFHHQQPLAVGAIALGMGALIGALLPSTRREDELLGQERDALMAKAQSAMQDELSRVGSVAKAKLDDVAQSAASRR